MTTAQICLKSLKRMLNTASTGEIDLDQGVVGGGAEFCAKKKQRKKRRQPEKSARKRLIPPLRVVRSPCPRTFGL
jgi:hypothetical protein